MRAAALFILASLLPLARSLAQASPPARGGPFLAPAGPTWIVPQPDRARAERSGRRVRAPGHPAAPVWRSDAEGGRARTRWFVVLGALAGGGGAFALCHARDTPTVDDAGRAVAAAGCAVFGALIGGTLGGLIADTTDPNPDEPF